VLVSCVTAHCKNVENCSNELLVKIPQDKIEKLQDQLTSVLSKRKVTLKEMQSLTGSLAFCTKALPDLVYSNSH
jgi:hypothetical protein